MHRSPAGKDRPDPLTLWIKCQAVALYTDSVVTQVSLCQQSYGIFSSYPFFAPVNMRRSEAGSSLNNSTSRRLRCRAFLTFMSVNDPRAVFLDYKNLDANETPFKRLHRYYDARAQDNSRICYTFPRSRMSILIILHKRIPLKDFKLLLLKFYKEKSTVDLTSNGDVEIRVVNREETDQNLLDDWRGAGDADTGDEDIKVSSK
jgi:hypothetical protein